VLPAAVNVSFEAVINCSSFRAGHAIEPRVPSSLAKASLEQSCPLLDCHTMQQIADDDNPHRADRPSPRSGETATDHHDAEGETRARGVRLVPHQPTEPIDNSDASDRKCQPVIHDCPNAAQANVRSGSLNEPAYAGARCARGGFRGNDRVLRVLSEIG
jgi:hypothetical protein